MPYIADQERRALLYPQAVPRDPGELNYAITALLDAYVYGRYGAGDISYVRINDVLGSLEGAKLEFYRRIAAPYENEKITENGEVYSCQD